MVSLRGEVMYAFVGALHLCGCGAEEVDLVSLEQGMRKWVCDDGCSECECCGCEACGSGDGGQNELRGQ